MTRRDLLTLPMPTGSDVLAVMPLLARALSGGGPVLVPRLSGAGSSVPHVSGSLRADEDDPADPTALVVSTSGSTGDPKGALLPVSALRASAAGTSARLGGPGTWLLALPAQHIAGLQVLLRSIVAGTAPEVLDLSDGFTPVRFVTATAALTDRADGGRAYTSLVPTQLTRLLDAGGEAVESLASYDAVLVGGAATAPAAIDRARSAGVGIVTTYGMSETCGGCLYDGRPLPGVWWRTEDDGRIEIAGGVLARGYRDRLDDPAFRTELDGSRWFRTDDLGESALDGTLRILGRFDDVIVTGGLKVSPALVEDALADVPGVGEVVVVGTPDAEWGERVVAVVVPSRTSPDGSAAAAPTLAVLHRRVADHVAGFAAPRQIVLVDHIPLIGPGKPDRAALRQLAAREGEIAGHPATGTASMDAVRRGER